MTSVLQHNTTAAPLLKLQITGNPSYDLNECDILNIVSSYGVIVNLELTGPRAATVEFDDIASAEAAQKQLQGHYVQDLGIKLYLSLSKGAEEKKKTYGAVKSLCDVDDIYEPTIVTQSLPNLDSDTPMFAYNSNRLSRKYKVQIDGDRDFKTASKIIGARGCNMKRIIEVCQQQARHLGINFQNDSLKIRLRGHGSGFKEGPEQKEADEALQLCVSSKHTEIYLLAVKLVEELLSGVYKEYAAFRQKANRPLKAPIQIKLIERSEEGLLSMGSISGIDSPRSTESEEVVTSSPPSNQWRSNIRRI